MMNDQMNRLQVVLKNMHRKKLLSSNEVDSILDGALRANAKINDILQDFFTEPSTGASAAAATAGGVTSPQSTIQMQQQQQQQASLNSATTTNSIIADVDILEKRILAFLRPDNNTNKSEDGSMNIPHVLQRQELKRKSMNPPTTISIKPQQTYLPPEGINFGSFFSTSPSSGASRESELTTKFLASLTPQKQHAYSYLRAILNEELRQQTQDQGDFANQAEKIEDKFETLCEELLMGIINPDPDLAERVELEIRQLLISKKKLIKHRIEDATDSLLKASVVPCDVFPVVRYTRDILHALFGIADFEVFKIHDSVFNSFSSRNIVSQSGVRLQ